ARFKASSRIETKAWAAMWSLSSRLRRKGPFPHPSQDSRFLASIIPISLSGRIALPKVSVLKMSPIAAISSLHGAAGGANDIAQGGHLRRVLRLNQFRDVVQGHGIGDICQQLFVNPVEVFDGSPALHAVQALQGPLVNENFDVVRS